MMDVKKALDEADGDRAKAVEILRVKGLKGVTKREGRSASNGLVAAQVDDGVGTLVEVNCETDFVAKGEKFIALADQVLAQAVALAGRPTREARSSEHARGRQDRPGPARRGQRHHRREDRGPSRGPPRGRQGRRPTCTRRAPTCRRRSASSSRSRVATRPWPATSRCTSRRSAPSVPDPRGGPGRDGRERASRRRGDGQGGGQAGGRPAEDRRGSRQRLLQGERPARAAVRQGAEEDRREGARGGRRQGHVASRASASASEVVDPTRHSPYAAHLTEVSGIRLSASASPNRRLGEESDHLLQVVVDHSPKSLP